MPAHGHNLRKTHILWKTILAWAAKDRALLARSGPGVVPDYRRPDLACLPEP